MAQDSTASKRPILEELVTWADIVDGALYESAEAAVEMNAPAMKLTLVIEGSKGRHLVQKIIRAMQHQPLAEIIADPEIQATLPEALRKAPADHRRHSAGGLLRPRRDLLRSGGSRHRGIQQVHSVLFVSRFRVHGFGFDIQLPNKGFGGLESLGARAAAA